MAEAATEQQYPARTASLGRSSYGDYQTRKKRARRRLPWLIPAMVIITAVAVAASMLRGDGNSSHVPVVDGLSLQQAEQHITQAGLRYTTRGESSQAPKGYVINTDPDNGASIAKSGSVTIYYSGAEVPLVLRTNYLTAEKTLQKAGFKVNAQPQGESVITLNPGTVWAQSPPDGSLELWGATVTINYTPIAG
jgi:beta-lactam-binding protein with PASTA domain